MATAWKTIGVIWAPLGSRLGSLRANLGPTAGLVRLLWGQLSILHIVYIVRILYIVYIVRIVYIAYIVHIVYIVYVAHIVYIVHIVHIVYISL